MKKNIQHLKNPAGSCPGNTLNNGLKHLFLAAFVFCALISSSQNEAKKWYFGYLAGLDFMTSPPTALTNGSVNTTEGCASIADASGNIIFYTDGITVYDKNHNVMANGTGLFGDGSSTQSGVIVKQPGNANIYYVFTQAATMGPDGFCYSTVDINLATTGSVTTKNVVLHTPSCEKITAVRHCNGVDVWVLSHDYGNSNFRAFLVSAAGVNTVSPVISSIGTVINSYLTTLGQMKISPNGKKLGLAIYDTQANQPYEIYDFDPATGVVSNSLILGMSKDNYGCEFSPDGTKFYGACYSGTSIAQWDLCAGSNSAIVNSMYAIPTNTSYPAQLQVATDGKIYVVTNGNLSTIEKPNLAGAACTYSMNSVVLPPGHQAALGLPNFINSFFKQAPLPFTYTAACQNVDFSPPAPQGTVVSGCSFATNPVLSYWWDFGDPASSFNNTATIASPSHAFSSSGTYTVKMVLNYACNSDTVRIPITVSALSFSLSGFSTVCAKDVRTYTAAGALTYSWSTGATTPTISLTTSVTTTYTVTAWGPGPNACKIVQPFKVTVAKCTGIEAEDASDTFIKIYPNPSNGNLNIDADKEVKIIITNALGQIILDKSLYAGHHNIDISAYKEGIYFVKSTSGSRSKINRLVKTE